MEEIEKDLLVTREALRSLVHHIESIRFESYPKKSIDLHFPSTPETCGCEVHRSYTRALDILDRVSRCLECGDRIDFNSDYCKDHEP